MWVPCMEGLGQLKMESLAFGITEKVDPGACQVHFPTTALQQIAHVHTHTHTHTHTWACTELLFIYFRELS